MPTSDVIALISLAVTVLGTIAAIYAVAGKPRRPTLAVMLALFAISSAVVLVRALDHNRSSEALTDTTASTQGKSNVPLNADCSIPLPSPRAYLKAVNDDVLNPAIVLPYTEYVFAIANRAEYDQSLFVTAPDLPPCGLNPKSTRLWVRLLDGATGVEIYRYCRLTSPLWLDRISVGFSLKNTPPESVIVAVDDRRCHRTVKSQPIRLRGRSAV